MEEQRKLEDCMALDGYWRQTAIKVIILGSSMEDQVEYFSERLVEAVCFGSIKPNDLRGGVQWANALDREVTERFLDGDKMQLDDKVEATARRLVHHAGRKALNQVKTSRKREILQIKLAQSQMGFGVRQQAM